MLLIVYSVLIIHYKLPQQFSTLSISIPILIHEPFKHRVKSHLPSAGIIRSSPYSPH